MSTADTYINSCTVVKPHELCKSGHTQSDTANFDAAQHIACDVDLAWSVVEEILPAFISWAGHGVDCEMFLHSSGQLQHASRPRLTNRIMNNELTLNMAASASHFMKCRLLGLMHP